MEARAKVMPGRRKKPLPAWIVIGLFLFLSSPTNTEGAHKLASQEFRNYEITRPKTYSEKKIISNTLTELGKHLTFIEVDFQAFREDFILKLELNRDLLPGSYTEKHFDERGKSVVTKPHIYTQSKAHCFYHGRVKDSPGSIVAVSTCSGISGFIYTTAETYYLEALGRNLSGRHVVYRESDRHRTHNLTCGHQDENVQNHLLFKNKGRHTEYKHQRLKRSLRGPSDKNSKTRVVELYVSNDYKQYLKYGSDVNNVIHRTKSIVNIVNALYHPLNIYIVLVGIEVWSKKDLIDIMNSADDTMNNYLDYRKKYINPNFANDNSQLISAHTFTNGVVGKAVKGVMCTYQYSGGVSLDHTDLVGPVATTVAHEMGHNFGMEHDTASCECEDYRCIMAATSGGPNPVHWSSCSRQQLQDSFDQGLDYCLQNVPEKTYDGPVCGNGFMEEGEECDCGLPEDCESRCCNASTCKLYSNATCATGLCCQQDTCQFKAAAIPCRSAVSGCDLPEFCTGESEWCPDDVYLQNGHSCEAAGMQAYCYNGQCRSHASQCALLWGSKTGRASIWECYKHFNQKGFSGGNCGYSWPTNTFKTCDKEDLWCGLLQCDHANERLMFWKDNLVLTYPENWITVNSTRYECKSVIMDVGLDMPDPGMVPDGVRCGQNKMCINHQCRPLSTLGIQTCATDCDNHGVCNSKGNCHCEVGFAPPLCSSPGNGGSIDSGPIKILETNVALIVGICLFFVVVLPLLAVVAFLSYKNREKLKLYVSVPTANKQPPPPPLPKAKPICKAVPVRSHSTVSEKPPPPPYNNTQVKRMSSFRDMEISTPVFQSSTNRTPVGKLSDVTCHDPLVRPASVVVPTSPREHLPERPCSVIIQGPNENKRKANISLATLAENKKSPNNAPSRPPYPPVWSTASSRNDHSPQHIPIQTRPLPEVPNDDQYYNEDAPRTDSIYCNEDSEDDLDGSVDPSQVRLKSDQAYINCNTSNHYREQAALPSKALKESPKTSYYNTDLKKSKSSAENKSKVSGLKKNFSERIPDRKEATNGHAAPSRLQKKHSFSSAYANDKQYISGPVLQKNGVSSTTNTTTKSGESNSPRSYSNVPPAVPKHSYRQNQPQSPLINNSDEHKTDPPPVPSHSYKQQQPILSKPFKKDTNTDDGTPPPVPSHTYKSKMAADNSKSEKDDYSSSSPTKPVGIVAAMKQKFKDSDDQKPESSTTTAVSRSKSSATEAAKRTRPVTRTQTSVGESSTAVNKTANKIGTTSTSDQRVKPPPPATKPPSLSRSMSSAGAANSNSNTDANRKRVARTKSNAGDRPNLPVPPKPPSNKRNSSAS